MESLLFSAEMVCTLQFKGKMMMSTKRIEIAVNLVCGSVAKKAHVSGYAYLESGFLQGLIIPEKATQISRAEQVLLTAFTFTGCPIAAHTEERDINPWVWTRGAYAGSRVLRGNGFTAESQLTSTLEAGIISMELALEIKGNLPDLVSIARPFQEEITELSLGILNGKFDIVFLTENGPIHCNAETRYDLDISRSAPTVFRNITILTANGDGGLAQVEQIDLFGNKTGADIDLAARLAVH